MYRFFKKDLTELDEKLRRLNELIWETGQQIGAACEDGEREHDNPEFDDATRRIEMWSRHLREMHKIRSQAIEISPSEIQTERVSVGCSVTYADQDGNERTVSIGSYMPAESSSDVSYNAPIARMLIGLKIGESREGRIAEKAVQFEVIDIKKTQRGF